MSINQIIHSLLTDGYVTERQLVYEKYFKCILLHYVQIHHIDSNTENNSIENLIPCFNGRHRKKYHKLNLDLIDIVYFVKPIKRFYDKAKKIFCMEKI